MKNMEAAQIFLRAKNFMDAYSIVMQPLCEELKMPQSALDILLFLANNPGYDTAGDICRCKGMKPAIVSLHVERLTAEGMLERRAVPGDRRKWSLVCTPAAAEIIERGRALQQQFTQYLLKDITPEDLAKLRDYARIFDRNIERIRIGFPSERQTKLEEMR